MAVKGLQSPIFRRIITVFLLVGISGTFMAMYYLVYLPQQQGSFNKRMFRILHEIANNFSVRAENYGGVSTNTYINGKYADTPISYDSLINSKTFNRAFKNGFVGKVNFLDTLKSEKEFKHDSIIYSLKKKDLVVHRTEKPLNEILEPLIAIHSKTFESILLVKLASDYVERDSKVLKGFDTILYKSSGFDIANISMDSLFPIKSIQAPAISNIDIEGIRYKLFLMPFQIKSLTTGTFVLTGIISLENYNKESQNLPFDFLITVLGLIVFLLLCLPFIKVFVLSPHENINISDIRLIIAAIFVIPFLVTLIVSSIWINIYPDNYSKQILSLLQNQVKANFFKEVQQCIEQAKEYNRLINDPYKRIRENITTFDPANTHNLKLQLTASDSFGLRDFVFYPTFYKNLENVHWLDSSGIDIASWRLTKEPATYFNLKDRQYFRDIKYKRYNYIGNNGQAYTMQATLSKLTGEFTINIAIPASVDNLQKRRSIATAISGKMYSVYNTVVPDEYGYSLINQKGEIIFDSDTARCLQENLLEETNNNQLLQNAMLRKDSTYIPDILLYDEPVKMIITPFDNLPYFLVTYHNKRPQYLFVFHIAAFVFLCMSILLLLASLFSYCIMISNKRLTTLNFIPGVLAWLKPYKDRKDYYIRNCLQLIFTMVIILLLSLMLQREQQQLYMLNYALLLPLFSITGFYIIKRAKNVIDKKHTINNRLFLLVDKEDLLYFLKEIRYIIMLYIISILFFSILQNVLIYNNSCPSLLFLKVMVGILILLLPLVMIAIALCNINYIKDALSRNLFSKLLNKLTVKRIDENSYLYTYLLSLVLSVLVVSIIPAITLTRFALQQEKTLHFQTFQFQLANRIQERRTAVNPKYWQTKLNLYRDSADLFVDSLKFFQDKGLYLGGLLLNMHDFIQDTSTLATCSPFYKEITQFLFLPPEHSEFFDDTSHKKFYYWKTQEKNQKSFFKLFYRNFTDYRKDCSISLEGSLPDYFTLRDVAANPLIRLLLIAMLILIFLYCKLLKSLAKRIFLLGYFDKIFSGNKDLQDYNDDSKWLRQKYQPVYLKELFENNYLEELPRNIKQLSVFESNLMENGRYELIMQIHLALIPVYEKIWKDCSDVEKFTLYDFSLDEFTNYKKVSILFQLFEKGLLIKDAGNFKLMTSSFRNFVLTKENTEEIRKLGKQGKGSWSAMRTIFYIILIAVATFIFLSQEEASKRLITIVTSLGALLPIIIKLFDKSTFATGAEKGSG